MTTKSPLDDPAVIDWTERVLRKQAASPVDPVEQSARHRLDHDVEILLGGLLSELASRGVDRYTGLASLSRVLEREDRDDHRVDLATRAVGGRNRPSDEFTVFGATAFIADGGDPAVEVGQYEFTPDEARTLAAALVEVAEIAEGAFCE